MSSVPRQAPKKKSHGNKGKILSTVASVKPSATTLMLKSMLEPPSTRSKRHQAPNKIKDWNRDRSRNPGDRTTMWSRVVDAGSKTLKAGSLADLVDAEKSTVSTSKDFNRKVKKKGHSKAAKEKVTLSESYIVTTDGPSKDRESLKNHEIPVGPNAQGNDLKPLAIRVLTEGSTQRSTPLHRVTSSSLTIPVNVQRKLSTAVTKLCDRQQVVETSRLPKQNLSSMHDNAQLKMQNLQRVESSRAENDQIADILFGSIIKPSVANDSQASLPLLDQPDFKNTRAVTQELPPEPRKRIAKNENYIKLNLRNSAGACREARNKKRKRNSSMNDKGYNETTPAPEYNSYNGSTANKRKPVFNSGVDPLDDYVDGVFHKHTGGSPKSRKRTEKAPNCVRHQLPCKLLTVRKNTKGNKGRKFYTCSMPRGEQCDHFEWADDTKEAAQIVLEQNSSYSGFVARQVASYGERFGALTVPELRKEARCRNLETTGRRQQLLTRLSLWVRDEITHSKSGRKEKDTVPSSSDSSVMAREEQEEEIENDGEESTSTSLDVVSLDSVSSGGGCFESSLPDDLPNEKENIMSFDGVDIIDQPSTENLEGTGGVHKKDCSLQSSLKSLFGYTEFREGQEWAIRRCIDQKRTLLVAPTSFGKSLCYALPAALMDGVCIVVSPLVSLIQDQLRQLPPRIPATTLSGIMSTAVMAAKIDDVLRHRLKILFVSPERLASSSFRRLFRCRWNSETCSEERQFPTVSLLCIDEAHCMSQWGHNFRPSYLRIRSFLDLAQPKSVLAITATAGPLVVQDMCRSLNVPFDGACFVGGPECGAEEAVKIMDCNRDNIDVSCMIMDSEEQRRSELSRLLVPLRNGKCEQGILPGCLSQGSVIVYVWRQRDAEVVAEYLTAFGVPGGIVVYHGGMDAVSRSKTQAKFMSGRARICVATVAFGLGINKTDISAIVHLHLPSSPENYLQEIGRAGRDGRPAKAIALVKNEDVVVRHSLAHSDSLCCSQVRIILEGFGKMVVDALEEVVGFDSDEHDRLEGSSISISIPIESSVIAADCKFESIETILSLLEARSVDDPLLRLEGTILDIATTTLKRRKLENLAVEEPLARCILECGTRVDESHDCTEKSFHSYSFGVHRFSVTRCSRLLGALAEPRHVFATLRRLQTAGELELSLDISSFHVRLESSGMKLFSRANCDGSLENLATELCRQFSSNVSCVAGKVQGIHGIMQKIAALESEPNRPCFSGSSVTARRIAFQDLVKQYFERANNGDVSKDTLENPELPKPFQDRLRRELSFDVTSLVRELSLSQTTCDSTVSVQLSHSRFADYTALALTKFFHAVDSPRLPYSTYSQHVLFGKWREVEFSSLFGVVTDILECKPT